MLLFRSQPASAACQERLWFSIFSLYSQSSAGLALLVACCCCWVGVGIIQSQMSCDVCAAGDRVSVAHVGDSRCVLADNGRAIALTRDHKASDPDEAKRVVRVSGGMLIAWA